ncbi:MAG: DEAD/DEAH box helicase [Candidatus Bathyarchaeia archaeon]
MRIDELPIHESVKKILLEDGICELYPPQEEAFRKTKVLNGGNLLLASPTASGKTLVAELCALKHILELNGKVLYTTPLKALASEKYERFKQYEKLSKFNGEHVRVAVSTGDYDSSDPWLGKYDFIVTTYEKFDSLLRHGAQWVKELSLLIVDEIHYIGQGDRGPTLEVVLTRFRKLNHKGQILALSATVRNVEEIAEWLNAEYITTDWRPVKLREGVYVDGRVEFNDGTVLEIEEHGSPIESITYDTIKNGGQILIFTDTRRNAVTLAKRLTKTVKLFLNKQTERSLKRIANSILSSEAVTNLDESLALSIENGVAFHHAGLKHDRRTVIEDAFRKGYIKALTATPTLAAGVNLPARRVTLTSYERYEPGYGRSPISVMEYKQMVGRAGRPNYDPIGESILIARNRDEADFIMEHYIYARPERIWSNLGAEPYLRSHVLSVIATDAACNKRRILEFFSKTLYAHQMGIEPMVKPISEVLNVLEENGFIRTIRDRIEATSLGKRVSELYIDPISAAIMVDGFESRKSDEITDFALLQLVVHTPDATPRLYPRRGEMERLTAALELHRDELLIDVADMYSDAIEFEALLGEVKMAIVLYDWINEQPENTILEKYDVEPGDLYRIVSSAEWLLYAAQELSKLMKLEKLSSRIRVLRERVKFGVKEELLPLISLEGIGRVRARALYNAGYKTIEDLKRASIEELKHIPTIGGKISKKIKEQVGGLISEKSLRATEEAGSQKMLTDYSQH